ncbi:hypothetical protein ACJX0J_028923, partial [Zea mays]
PLVFSIIKTKHRAFKGGNIDVLYGDHHYAVFTFRIPLSNFLSLIVVLGWLGTNTMGYIITLFHILWFLLLEELDLLILTFFYKTQTASRNCCHHMLHRRQV